MTSLLDDLSRFCANYHPTARQRSLAHAAISDTLGCMVAGRDEKPAQWTARGLQHLPKNEGKARLITGGRSRPDVAAAVNATAAHALDFDDNFRAAMAHASAVIVPALLAVSDVEDSSGQQFVEAYLVALAAQGYLGSGLNPAHYTAGWHGTSTIGTIGTAAGTAYLTGANAKDICKAMSVAVSMACGMKGQFGSAVKPFHAGLAARNAVEAAYLARAGLFGHADIIERDQGLVDMMGGGGTPGFRPLSDWAQEGHPVETVGLMTKRFPCCASTHMALDMLLDLMNTDNLAPEMIDRIDVKVRIANHRNLPFHHPGNGMEARFSMHYCLTRMLRNGTITLADFEDDEVRKSSGDPLLSRIDMHTYLAEEEEKQDFLPHILSVRLIDGRILERQKASPKGSIGEPLSVGERKVKFLDCCQPVREAEIIFSKLEDLSDMPDLAFLDNLFLPSAPHL